jgi:integrase/recombinase XerD
LRLKRLENSRASRTVAANAAKRGRTTQRDASLAARNASPIRGSRPTGNVLLLRYEKYLLQHALSPITIRNDLADLRAFLRWHAGRLSKPIRLVSADFTCYRAHLCRETGRSTATVNRHLQSLRLFGRFMFELGWIDQDLSGVIELVRNGSDKKGLPRILTPTEVARLCYAIQSGRPSLVQRDFAIVQLMLEAGLRVHEVAALRMNDLAPRRMRIAAPGAQIRGRVVPLTATAARALRAYLIMRPAVPQVDHVFVSQRGQSLSVRSIQRLVDTYARSAGLKGVCAQSLRHTCAKSMLDQTRDDALVARRLGHCSTRMLKRYHHP